MKILMYSTRFFPDPKAGGQSAVVKNLILALQEKNVNVDLVTYWQGKLSYYSLNNSEIKRIFPLFNRKTIDYILKPIAELKSLLVFKEKIKEYDILHIHGPTYGFYFPPRYHTIIYKSWKKFSGKIPIIYHFHGSLYTSRPNFFPNYNTFLKQSLDDAKSANHIIVLTSETRNVFLEYMPKKPVTIIYNFVDDIFLKEYKNINNYPEKFTILYVGGKLHYKGYYDILRIKNILSKYNIKFKLIGSGLHKIPYEKMPLEYLSASIVIAPSYREGLPPSLLEAQALKRPVIATRIGGIPEIVIHGKTGFLVDPGNIEEMIKYILLLKENPDLLRRMGEAARRHVLEKFRKDVVINELINIYKLYV